MSEIGAVIAVKEVAVVEIVAKSVGAAVQVAATGVVIALGVGTTMAEEPVNTVRFACADGKSIAATFFPDKVDLVLSDGRSLSLPQTMSGSGIRYANAEETFVFWSKGDTAFVTEGADAHQTFADCVTES